MTIMTIKNILKANQEIERLNSILAQIGVDTTQPTEPTKSIKVDKDNFEAVLKEFNTLRGSAATQFYNKHRALLSRLPNKTKTANK